ncbi:hypothetical protein I7I53_10245 [Histoplasma capsulatum var. duboisii H88]|uniref:Uncharacterized protein n=1 Tax=Ajellomyces capsulatus (strain H88) TaxID=544711 RepID=A0A8A1L837_AJEC8|nr:hypothetical protein I7I53_10245 [Histoplasma capsulatum var. duboisii H88]
MGHFVCVGVSCQLQIWETAGLSKLNEREGLTFRCSSTSCRCLCAICLNQPKCHFWSPRRGFGGAITLYVTDNLTHCVDTLEQGCNIWIFAKSKEAKRNSSLKTKPIEVAFFRRVGHVVK